MSRRQSRRQTDHAQEPLEEFQAYGEYNYAYRHEKKAGNSDEEIPQDAEEREPLSSRQRPQRIPLEKEAPRRRRHSVLSRLIFLLVCAVAGLIVLQETVFRLESVYVIGYESKTPQQITALSGLVKGRNIFDVTEEEIRQNFTRDHTVEFIRMQKEYPSTIYLYINERKRAATFQWKGILYTLDEQGLVMDESNTLLLPEGMPVITGFQFGDVRVGRRLELKDQRQLTAYMAVISELYLQLYNTQISELNVTDPDNLYLVTVNGITVRLGNAQYARAKIGAVRTDMVSLIQLGKTGGVLDVSIPEDAKYTPDR